jgi:hypothetical protein
MLPIPGIGKANMRSATCPHSRLTLAVWFLNAVVPTLTAQSAGTGALTGTVMDPSRRMIPNVSVTLTSFDTAQVRVTATGPDGAYKFAS